jgi:hypothetical protein
MIGKFYGAPTMLRKGLSAQYGPKSHDPGVSDSVWFNFTVYENGEVQIRNKDSIMVLDKDAVHALQKLWQDALSEYHFEIGYTAEELNSLQSLRFRQTQASR